jgi:hypothetical protein
MADMMPKQVITLHHFDAKLRRSRRKFFAILYSTNHVADHFCLDRAIGIDATAKFAMLTVSARALIFYSGIIVTGVSFAFGYAKSGIGFLNTNFKWLMAIRSVFGCLGSVFFILGLKPTFGGRFCHCIAFTFGIRNFGVHSYLMSAYPFWHGPQC